MAPPDVATQSPPVLRYKHGNLRPGCRRAAPIEMQTRKERFFSETDRWRQKSGQKPRGLARTRGGGWPTLRPPVSSQGRGLPCPVFRLPPRRKWSAGRRQGFARPLWVSLAIGKPATPRGTGLRDLPPRRARPAMAGLRSPPPGRCASRRSTAISSGTSTRLDRQAALSAARPLPSLGCLRKAALGEQGEFSLATL